MSEHEERERVHVRLSVWIDCPKCWGAGEIAEPLPVALPCLRCNGAGGWYLEEESDGS